MESFCAVPCESAGVIIIANNAAVKSNFILCYSNPTFIVFVKCLKGNIIRIVLLMCKIRCKTYAMPLHLLTSDANTLNHQVHFGGGEPIGK